MMSFPHHATPEAAMTAILKTFTFAGVHFMVAFSVAYLLTGSIAVSGALALCEPACNTIAYYVHERVWSAATEGRGGRSGRRAFA